MRNLFVCHMAVLLVFAGMVSCRASQSAKSYNPLPDQKQASCKRMVDSWVRRAFGEPGAMTGQSSGRLNVPFSFHYDGKNSHELLDDWEFSSSERKLDKATLRVNTYKDPNTGLVIECEIKTYPDSPAVDWVCYLSNHGTADTPIIEGFMPLDAGLLEDSAGCVLRWSNGDVFLDKPSPEGFLYHDEALIPGSEPRRFAPARGRSSDFTAFPFFNVKGRDGGWIVAVGWSGQWAARFAATKSEGVTIQAGMEKTHFRLRPGERVRTPRIVLLRWLGDEMIHGHNLFRRMMLKHYVPNHDVGTDGSPIPISLCDVGEMVFKREWKAPTEENQLSLIKRGAELGFDAYWLDAYWFAGGDWIPSAESFPRGLQPIANAAHGAGMKFILWFEPEWIRSDSQLTKEHPEFIYGGANGGPLKLGDRKAREFMIDFLDKRIKEYGVDIFRHDYNNPAIGYWHAEGGEDRQGVTEMLYIEGLYTLWSDLLKRNPGLIIDNCAGGGRRIDIESCSLTHQFYKSDWNDYREQSKGSDYWPRTSVAEQVMLNGLALYVPYRAGVLWDMRPYIFRSAMASGFVYLGCLEGDDLFRKQSHEAIAELKALRPLFLGDYYPLLELTSRQEDWCAYQFDRPDLKEGCVFVFRRPDSRILMCELSLYNIDVSATYEVSLTGETYRQGPWNKMRGSDLASREIRINDKPGSVLLRYRRLDVGK